MKTPKETMPASRDGSPSDGGEFGAKISDVQSGVKTIDYVAPKSPEPPVRH